MALSGTIVPSDAAVVTLLRAAGGVLLGKANYSEWASMLASCYSMRKATVPAEVKSETPTASHCTREGLAPGVHRTGGTYVRFQYWD